jgi:steroid delta-isomerase-like uncharacterized protein
MSTDLVKFTVDLVSAWNDHDITRILTFYAEDYYGEDVSQATPIQGHHGVEHAFRAVLGAFPDLRITERELVTQENRVAVAWTLQGSQQGMVMNIPPTGRRISVRGGSFYALDHGKIAQGIQIWDVAGLLRAIGLLPDL